MEENIKRRNELFLAVRQIIEQAHLRVIRQSNTILLQMYWETGRLIVKEGQKRAKLWKRVLKELLNQLTLEFGKGFDESNLKR
jgi:hypothetical protein